MGLQNIDLSTFKSSQGIIISGGTNAKKAGDVNGDGYADIIIGLSSLAASYVVYGRTNLTNIDLTAPLSVTQGFSISGAAWSYSGLGDVNGDKIDDIVATNRDGPQDQNNPGESWIIYGSSNPVNIDVTSFSSTQGFSVVGGGNSGPIVAWIGNVNKDNYADIIIGAPLPYNACGNDCGAGYVVLGQASNANINFNHALTFSPGFSIASVSYANDGFGLRVNGVGDFNGDGYDDVIFGAYGANSNAGISYVIFGSSSSTNIQLPFTSITQGFTITGAGSGDQSGYSISGAGDVNRDGLFDIIIGAPYLNSSTGAAYVVFGTKNPANIQLPPGSLQGFEISGKASGDNCGMSVGGIGDINSDGYDDIIIGCPYANSGDGVSYVIFGGTNLSNINLAAVDLNANNQGFLIIGGSNNQCGSAVNGVGDINNDGINDMSVGANGTAYIIYGYNASTSSPTLQPTTKPTYVPSVVPSNIPTNFPTANPTDKPTDMPTINPTTEPSFLPSSIPTLFPTSMPSIKPTLRPTIFRTALPTTLTLMPTIDDTIELDDLSKDQQGFSMLGNYDKIGYSVSGAGDLNKDGYDDLIIGEPSASSMTGASYIIYGNSSNFMNIDLKNLDKKEGFAIYGIHINDTTGYSVSSVGDFNNDGFSDVVIGAPGVNSSKGISYVIFGNTTLENLSLSNLGHSNKGFSIIGANINDASGISVSGVGDFNNDSYADIIIGAYGVNYAAGVSYLIFGHKNNFTDIYLSEGATGVISFIGGNLGDHSGFSVGNAGDVNGDGFDDVIIGAPGANNDTGISYVIFGKATTISNIELTKLSAEQGFHVAGANIGDKSGYAVNGAGDVNGDGYDDIIIGAPQYGITNHRGISYVVFGKGYGFSNISLTNLSFAQGFSIIGANFNDLSGSSVSGVGDVNNDGYDDVIVGSPGANDYAGVSYIIWGKKDNFFNIYLTNITNDQGLSIIGNKTEDKTGYSVNGARDYNGDGFFDVIIGGTVGSYMIFNLQMYNKPTAKPTAMPIQIITKKEHSIYDMIDTIKFRIIFSMFTSIVVTSTTWCFRKKIGFYILDNWDKNGCIYKMCESRYGQEHYYYREYQLKKQLSDALPESRRSHFEMADNSGLSSTTSRNVVQKNPVHTRNTNILNDDFDHRLPSTEDFSAANKASSCILLSIDAMIEPKYLKEQDIEFSKFAGQLMNFINEELSNDITWLPSSRSDSETLFLEVKPEGDQAVAIYREPTLADNSQFASSSNELLFILNAKQILHNLQLLHYLAQNIINYLGYNVTLPDPLDNKELLISADLVLGNLAAQYLPEQSIMNGMFISTASTASYALKLAAADYLKNQEIVEEPIEFAQQCAATIAAYALPGLVNYALTKTILPDSKMSISALDMLASSSFGVVQCYNNYKVMYGTETQATVTDIIVPYIADAITLWSLRSYLNFDGSSTANLMMSIKNAMSVAATTYATHCVSSMVMDALPQEVKEYYVDPVFDFASNTINDFVNTCYQSATDVGAYIAEEISLIMEYVGISDLREDF